MIRVEDLTVHFGGLVALDAINVEFTAPVSGIIGPNGAGKTTTMNAISGFIDVAGGRVLVDGANLLDMAPHRRALWGLRRSFQKAQIADDLTVFDNLLAICDNLPGAAEGKRDDLDRAAQFAGVTELFGQPGGALNTYQRRLADIARCVIGSPRMIMLDEPGGGLNGEETETLGQLISGIPDFCGAQVLVIDHDVDLIERVCRDTLVLDFGKRIAFGPTKEVLADPHVQAAYLGGDIGEVA
ncbi:ABC transporter ATP-binding protein [Roseibium sp. Sym1]|uniref:ABC transporter ATP-binding protein n=1 Tax=Roseibium sp. Sym1 TaxID=3016006 RepID=UPI0022B3C059|nr:ATP-binding cassette domain-containing protein [Roseibium sp. Sym1]